MLGAWRALVLMGLASVGMALGPAASLAAQGTATLQVAVIDAASGSPLSGVQVRLRGHGAEGVTNELGLALFGALRPGADVAMIRHLGYAPELVNLVLKADSTTTLQLALKPAAARLEEVEVAGARASRIPGWSTRRLAGTGTAITREDIERKNPSRSIDILRGVPGLRLELNGGKTYIKLTTEFSILNPCRSPNIYLDGVIVQSSDAGRAARQLGSGAGSYFDFIQPESIEAVEIFSRPSQIPVEYRGTGASCGVILIWTRAR